MDRKRRVENKRIRKLIILRFRVLSWTMYIELFFSFSCSILKSKVVEQESLNLFTVEILDFHVVPTHHSPHSLLSSPFAPIKTCLILSCPTRLSPVCLSGFCPREHRHIHNSPSCPAFFQQPSNTVVLSSFFSCLVSCVIQFVTSHSVPKRFFHSSWQIPFTKKWRASNGSGLKRGCLFLNHYHYSETLIKEVFLIRGFKPAHW